MNARKARFTIRSVHRVSQLLPRRDTMSVPMALAHAAITSAPPAIAASDRPVTGITIWALLDDPQSHRTYDRPA